MTEEDKSTEKDEVVESEDKAAEAAETEAKPEAAETEAKPPVNKWDGFITPFAAAIGKKPEDVIDSLKTVVGEPGDEAIALLQNEEDTPFGEIQAVLSDVPVAKLRKAVRGLRKAAEAPVAAESRVQLTQSFDILPSVPDDVSFLEMLKTGGVLKIGVTEVISAIRAGLANRTRLYDLPNILVRKMEDFAQTQDEPCSEDFYAIRKLVIRRNYAEVLSVLNVDANLVTEARKKELLSKLDEVLWDSLFSYNEQVKGWVQSWQQGAANPAALFAAIASIGGGGAGLPAGMMQPPPTDQLRDAAEGVIDKINRIFAGMGIPISRALAWDANKIKGVLENPALPVQLGAGNREQMLKMLDVDVSSDYVRLERNVTRYALAIMEYPKVTAGESDIAYLTALFQLGVAIPWDTLTSPGKSPRRDSCI